MNTTIAPLVIDAKMAAIRLSLSSSTLAKLRLSGNGPIYSKLGRRVVYQVNDLDAWVSAHRYKSTSEYDAKVG